VTGIHHITAISADPQGNVDFYVGVLGLRFVKRTVNFDDPRTYHFYFGDDAGSPGSLMTFFPWTGSRPGRVGPGQVAETSFAIAPASLSFWWDRLTALGVSGAPPRERRFGDHTETVLHFQDPEGQPLALVADPRAESRPAWGRAPGVPSEHAIHGFHSAALWPLDPEGTQRVLVEDLGFHLVGEGEATTRYAVGSGGPSALVDVMLAAGEDDGWGGAGTVHHIAWAVADDAAQRAIRGQVVAAGLRPTGVIDRQYFRSVYFREPGGTLFELATAGPGMAIDEPPGRLGEALMLPPQYEPHRADIEASLPPLLLPGRAHDE
jgi:glyoxalase family protein